MDMNWSPDEDKLLIELREKKVKWHEIAQKIGRGYGAVRTHYKDLQSRKYVIADNLKTRRSTEGVSVTLEEVENNIDKINVKIKDVELKVKYSKVKKSEVSILDLSDAHVGSENKVFDSKIGKEVITYNYSIFLKELENLREAIFRIHHLHSSAYNLEKLYINMLGDLLTNDRIFEGQRWQITDCVGQQIWDCVNNFASFIASLKSIYKEIIVTGVVGNHGRSTTEYQEEPVQNNYEYQLYRILQLLFKNDKRITFNVPNTYRHILEIEGHKHLLEHGSSFRGATETAIERQVKELIVNVGNFDVLDMAHFHKIAEMEVGDSVLVKRNGSWIEKDIYAFNKFKSYSKARQWFYGTTKHRVTTWNYKVNLVE